MNRISLPVLFLKMKRELASSKLTVPSMVLLYPNTPPSYLALTDAGAGGGPGIVVEFSGASCGVVVRGRCAKTTVATLNARAITHAERKDLFIGFSSIDSSEANIDSKTPLAP